MNGNKYDLDLLSAFGIKKDVKKTAEENLMTVVKARVLKAPKVFYKGNKPVEVKRGQWNLINQTLYKTSMIENWLIIWMAEERHKNKADNEMIRQQFMKSAKDVFQASGLMVGKPIVQILLDHSVENIFELIKRNCPNVKIVLFIIHDENENYNKIKIGEKEHGITTQCLKLDKIVSYINFDPRCSNPNKERAMSQYLGNVSLKINAKIGGINNLVDWTNIERL